MDQEALIQLAEYFDVTNDYLLARTPYRYNPEVLRQECVPGTTVSDVVEVIPVSYTHLRMILPKKTNFEFLTQWDVNLIVSHINSTPKSSYDLPDSGVFFGLQGAAQCRSADTDHRYGLLGISGARSSL